MYVAWSYAVTIEHYNYPRLGAGLVAYRYLAVCFLMKSFWRTVQNIQKILGK